MESFFEWIVLCVGAVVVIDVLLDLHHGRMTLTWPQVAGRDIFAEARQGFFSGGRPVANVRYRYRVDGRHYECDRYTFRTLYSIRSAELAAYRYPPGTEVTVFHHPSIPDRAVLLPGAGSGPWFQMLIGAGFDGVAAYHLLLAR